MQNIRILGLISGAVALAAVACGSGPAAIPAAASPSPAGSSAATATPSSATPTPGAESKSVKGTFVEIDPTGLVEQDLDFEDGLRSARFSLGGWKTDFSYHTVPYDEFLSGGPPRDGIPPLDNPRFDSIDQADGWLAGMEPVISFEINGDQRAYPLQVLIWHEIVNDVVGGVPVAVTFCPLCNSAIVFERTVGGRVLDFGTTGNLRNSDLVMWDRQTESWWQQFTGEAIVGVMAGTRLTFLPAPIVSWQDFMTYQPDGKVLSKDTGFDRRYGQNPYVGYDRVDEPPFLLLGDSDGRLQPKERVAAVTVDGVNAAFPFAVLAEEGAVNYRVNGVDLAVLFKSGTNSALDGARIESSKDIGSTGVFKSELNGQKLTFTATDGSFTDAETGSTWNILGEATNGPLTGERLTKMVHAEHFWFAWGAFKPDTLIYHGVG
ncbi:MAG: DUF3179 domain-containing protein [Chloroflexi bacterium]|nr:DUF3179 domain-containing protein [Chloroflexota bacterium]MDA1269826.1 DUF3179 domain-containing protein [Chloroflexota bacterium]PKB58477.1 MAG: hypothetical protein BZY83_06970 [SAR202 cluster bacterium Casp-Chloro-G2]